jgi:hypothetical protein
VTLEPSSDEKQREEHIADHAHVNDHGGRLAEAEFWDKYGKGGQHGYVEQTTKPVGRGPEKRDVT